MHPFGAVLRFRLSVTHDNFVHPSLHAMQPVVATGRAINNTSPCNALSHGLIATSLT